MSNLPAPPEPPAPQVQKKRHYLLWGILVVVAIIGIGELATKSDTQSETPTNTVPGVDQGLGSQDASADVKFSDAPCDVGDGVLTCQLDIVNHSDGTSDYYIEATIYDAGDANIGFANATAQRVEPGGTAHVELTGTYTGKSDHVKLTEVQRTAS